MTPALFSYVVLPLLIFFARIADVSLGTLRICFIARGIKIWAAVFSFFEVFIWLLAITQIMKNLHNIYYYVFYAGGFSAGTFIGLWIESKLAMGTAIIRVILSEAPPALLTHLKEMGFGITLLKGQGLFQPVQVLLMIVKRKWIQAALEIIQQYNPNAFYTIEDVRSVSPSSLSNLQINNNKTEPLSLNLTREGK